jgi:hypothetical protein
VLASVERMRIVDGDEIEENLEKIDGGNFGR